MTHEEFTGVTFNHRNGAKYTVQGAYFMNRETTYKIIVYARNT